MKKAIVAFALQEEVVPVSIPGFEVYTILTKITKVQAAFRLTKAIFELQPDFVLNVGTAGTLAYSVGDIFSATHFIESCLHFCHKGFYLVHITAAMSFVKTVIYKHCQAVRSHYISVV